VNDTIAGPSPQTSLRYQPGLDGLRAISVLAVMFFHQYFVFGTERGFMPGGFLGVEVFFVVSGYLITSLLLAENRDSGRISLKNFWFRRARRLLPALYVLLAVVVAYSLLFLPDSIATLKGDVIAALTYTSNWWQIISHRSYAVTAGRPELLKHLWSLAIEEQFYLCWPPLLYVALRTFRRKSIVTTIIVVALASTVLMAITAQFSINFAYYSTFTRLSGLLLGSAMAFFYAPYRIRKAAAPRARLVLNASAVVGLVLLLVMFRMYRYPITSLDSRSVFDGGFLLVDIATLLVIAAVVHPVSDAGRIIGCKPLRWVGVRSYSLYLWHYPIFCVTRPGLDFQHFGHLRGWPVFVVRLVLSFGAAELSYRFVETPIRKGAIGRYVNRVRAAHGETKQKLERRGALVVGSCTLLVIVLGVGLAVATPQVEAIAGPSNGAVPDPSAVNALRGATSTTVTPNSEAASHPGASTSTTTSTESSASSKVLAIGDSVMLGAKPDLLAAIPGIAVDAVKSRQFGEAVAIVGYYKQNNILPPTIVIHLGTNGVITTGALDQIMSLTGNSRVFFVNDRVPRVWESGNNALLNSEVPKFKNAQVLDWRDFSGCHSDWFVPEDGFHLEPPGQHGYTMFIQAALAGHPLSTCTP
jgi:peptidoglycan/LPS O-acetylase OafA/YrhL